MMSRRELSWIVALCPNKRNDVNESSNGERYMAFGDGGLDAALFFFLFVYLGFLTS